MASLLGVWATLAHGRSRGGPAATDYDPRTQRIQAKNLSPGVLGANSRDDAFCTWFVDMIPSVDPCCQPILHQLDGMRFELIDRYTQAELPLVKTGADVDNKAFHALHAVIANHLAAAGSKCPA